MRFADFELDTANEELRRNGQTVRLERIPMQLLCLLALRPGQLVSRAEIIQHLWGQGVFLDTDNGINTAIRKIRIALHDDPEQPRFIATRPGKGYRFIAPILEEPLQPIPEPQPDSIQTPPPANPLPLPPGRRRIWIYTAALLLTAACAAGAFFWIRGRQAPAPNRRIMIAVLPFVNLSGDASQDYFADGMTEELITQLGSISPDRLGVIARTSAMHYKHTSEEASQIAHELGVSYLLEGSVRRAGDDIRVTAQLIQANDQTHLWASDYDTHLTNILDIQTSIATAITRQIRLALPASGIRPAPVNTASYEAYLRGKLAFEQRTPPSMSAAIAQLTQAVTLDSQSASAWAALARAYSLAPVFHILPSNVALPKARDAALHALTLDPNSSVAHCTLAFVMAHYDFDWPGAEREFQRAIALNPSDPYNHLFYSNSYLSPQGWHAQAIAEMQKAIALDPLSFPVQSFYGRTLVWAGRTSDALAQFSKATRSNPNSALEYVRLAHTYAAIGDYPNAIRAEETARILAGESPEAAVAQGQLLRNRLHDQGANGYWQQEIQFANLPNNPPESFTGAYGIAILYAQLGQKQQAIAALHQALLEHDLRLTEISIEPLFKPLHADPAFQAIQTRIGLPQSL